MIVAEYTVQIEEEMVLRSIKTGMMQFIYCLFAFEKNFEEGKSRAITLDFLIKKVSLLQEDKRDEYVK